MFEDAKVDRLLFWSNAPGDGMFSFDVDPSHEVRLETISAIARLRQS